MPNARLDRSEALRYLGYTGQQVDEALLTRFNRLADECERVIAPSFAWSVFGIDEKRTCWEAAGAAASRVRLNALDAAVDAAESRSAVSSQGAGCGKGLVPQVALAGCDLVLEGNSIAGHLRGACKVALMACTLGAVSEREMRKHEAISVADGVMFGACCSALVEAAANITEDAIVRFANDMGLSTNWAFQPRLWATCR